MPSWEFLLASIMLTWDFLGFVLLFTALLHEDKCIITSTNGRIGLQWVLKMAPQLLSIPFTRKSLLLGLTLLYLIFRCHTWVLYLCYFHPHSLPCPSSPVLSQLLLKFITPSSLLLCQIHIWLSGSISVAHMFRGHHLGFHNLYRSASLEKTDFPSLGRH